MNHCNALFRPHLKKHNGVITTQRNATRWPLKKTVSSRNSIVDIPAAYSSQHRHRDSHFDKTTIRFGVGVAFGRWNSAPKGSAVTRPPRHANRFPSVRVKQSNAHARLMTKGIQLFEVMSGQLHVASRSSHSVSQTNARSSRTAAAALMSFTIARLWKFIDSAC